LSELVPTLIDVQSIYINSKDKILKQWISYDTPKTILKLHQIDENYFIDKYASGVFDYFMGVISAKTEIGNCPVMQELLSYLKVREISADELFEICSHFRRSMVDFSYDVGLNSKDLFDEISYIFDKNFGGILKFYTDTIFQKLIDARQEALQAGQAKEYFLSNMSHEIRTPLNAILGFVNLLIDEEITQKHRNYLEIILSSGENLLSIINDILDFSKLRSGEFTIEPKIFSLHEELSHTMELFVASANLKDITLTSFIDPKIPIELYGDVLRIKQIVSNFISNAIKFTHIKGLIEIRAFYKNGILNIDVKDNGIGIGKKDLDSIFIAFSQVNDTEFLNIGGTGLGLSISNQLAELMDGKVYVKSKLGLGSTFSLKIPVIAKTIKFQEFDDIEKFRKLKMVIYHKNDFNSEKYKSFLKYANIFDMDVRVVNSLNVEYDICIFVHEDSNEDFKRFIIASNKKYIALMSKDYDIYNKYQHIQNMCFPLYCIKMHQTFSELLNPTEYSPHTQKISLRFKGKVLVAEDNEANQELIKILLSKYGLMYDVANNGLEAFNLYKSNSYDLILIDEQMPIMDGNEAVKEIIKYEENKGLRHTPISALTANVIKGVKERGLISGFDAFLGKPIILKDLERVFKMYLKQDVSSDIEIISSINIDEKIIGLDVEKLSEELMLNDNELLMLIELFIKKMSLLLPQLDNAIDDKRFEDIKLLSHSIKGSSGNFRITLLQEISNEMEDMAKNKNQVYNYKEKFLIIKNMIENIEIK